MESVRLQKIEKKGNKIVYKYALTNGLKQYFLAQQFIIEYPESVETVPDAIAAVPFVCSVLPIIWLTDSELIVPELDEAFTNCIPEVKEGYVKMYPESQFLGNVVVNKVIPCSTQGTKGACAMFYSGGVDSMDTLIRHLEERPSLITIWGSDIRYDNLEGWTVLERAINEASQRYSLPEVVIKSTFREFDNEGELNRRFGKQLQRNYWYGVKHGIALLGHVAPYAYLHDLSRMYIASSNCIADGTIRCASDPTIDNMIRFSSCEVCHDAFECTRQDKVNNIVRYYRGKKDILPLHVCWETQTGVNCCWCEKCYRTMTELILEGANPKDYGFPEVDKSLPWMHERIVFGGKMSAPKTWGRIHDDLLERRSELKKSPYWGSIKWIGKVDFRRVKKLKMPMLWRVKNRLSKSGPYQWAKKRIQGRGPNAE